MMFFILLITKRLVRTEGIIYIRESHSVVHHFTRNRTKTAGVIASVTFRTFQITFGWGICYNVLYRHSHQFVVNCETAPAMNLMKSDKNSFSGGLPPLSLK